nr:MAG TPA: hypothetical protein [Caudoviricetes sp.]DAS33705.1 MAG TPA: hypothetical protein [Caudoviricetes sp.]
MFNFIIYIHNFSPAFMILDYTLFDTKKQLFFIFFEKIVDFKQTI